MSNVNVPKLGDLRVWWKRNNDPIHHFEVPNLDVAVGVIFGLSMGDLENDQVVMNMCGLEVYEDIEDGNGPSWNEWYDDETGESIDQYTDSKYDRKLMRVD